MRNDSASLPSGAMPRSRHSMVWNVHLRESDVCHAELHSFGPDASVETTWSLRPGSYLAFIVLDRTARYALRRCHEAAGERASKPGRFRICDRRYAWTLSVLNDPLHVFSLCFSAAALARLCAPPAMQLAGLGEPQRTTDTPDAVLLELARAAAGISKVAHEAGREGIEHLVQAFLLHLGNVYARFEPDRQTSSDCLASWQVRRAKELMHTRLAEKVSLPEVAGSCGLSPSYFSRLFKNSTGLTTHQWLIEQRVERAKQLLSGTRMPLVDIAFATGFADQTHFTRVFSRRTQTSPLVWRRLARCAIADSEPLARTSSEPGRLAGCYRSS